MANTIRTLTEDILACEDEVRVRGDHMLESELEWHAAHIAEAKEDLAFARNELGPCPDCSMGYGLCGEDHCCEWEGHSEPGTCPTLAIA